MSILSCILLTACGGSNNSNSSDNSNSASENNQTNTKIADQAWTSFNIHGDDSKGKLNFEIDQRTIKDGQYYLKIDHTYNDTEYYNLSFFVTSDGVYGDGPIHPEYGVQLGSANGSSEKQILSHYSQIGSKGFQTTSYYKTIDISGKSISESINPEDIFKIQNNFNTNQVSKTLLKFYADNATQKFPLGSSCSIITQESSSQNYIELYLSSKDNPDYVDLWKKESQKEAGETIKKLFKDTTAYIKIINDEPNNQVYAKYENSIYSGNYYDKGIDFDLNQFINDKKLKINQDLLLSVEEKKLALAQVDLEKTKCIYFNETASKTIRDSINNFNK